MSDTKGFAYDIQGNIVETQFAPVPDDYVVPVKYEQLNRPLTDSEKRDRWVFSDDDETEIEGGWFDQVTRYLFGN